MRSEALRKAVAGHTDESARAGASLRADGRQRVALARDDRWPPAKTVMVSLGAAAAVLAMALLSLALR